MRKILPIYFIAALAVMAFDAEDYSPKTKQFLQSDTSQARTQIASFSDEELLQATQTFKKDHSKAEQRIFWLSEEYYRRNAERVAAERIRYLFFAVVAALGIITVFSILTYSRSRR